ncbi:MAG: Re/Si-specific NAD(P)(+) transhydrogenase subunit alpha [Acidobacteria bacterium]|nr:Re/Si-specific NAD(P)(+) transhydrogenase subunit alpha [Acidobacteriota bacterium]
MIIGVPKETFPGERRVALIPAVLPQLAKAQMQVLLERSAGTAAGFADAEYEQKGARIAATRRDVFDQAGAIAQVRTPGANLATGRDDIALLSPGKVIVGLAEPLVELDTVRTLAERRVTSFALELMPRITRAQSMDVLSSMASIAGYKAVILAAGAVPRLMPMMMTAAGTLTPANVFVIGAGVAGLQAIATARRLGARVSAYDVRPAVKEQVQSLGAKFIELPLETGAAEDKGGYAKAQDETFYRRQREMMLQAVAESHVVITTALIPGRKAPVLVTADMVRGMMPGSVVIDLAAERGGNCELTRADEAVVENGVTILGPTNLPATVPYHASQMYARNMTAFLLHIVQANEVKFDMSDEITVETLVTKGGEVVHPRLRQMMGLEPAATKA